MIIALLGALLLILLSMASITLRSLRSFDRSSERVAHSLSVKQEIFQTLTALLAAETSQRGYLITGESKFLAPYFQSVTNVTIHLAQLRLLTHDNATQQALLDQVVPLTAERLLMLRTSLDLQQQHANVGQLTESLEQGQALMERLRLRFGAMVTEEERKLIRREQARLDAERMVTFNVAALALVSLGIMAWMALIIRSEFRRRTLAEVELAQKNVVLQETVGTLESYSYSIVHDMRAPLRAMSSFAQLLRSEYGARLDENGHFYLDRISQGAFRLDRLIQDVLTYSRMDRDDLPLQEVRLGALLNDIVREFPELASTRARVQIASGCHVTLRSNIAALSQIFSNLLRNAVKFVAPGVTPEVKISCEQRDGMIRIEVRDNGIGISPEHQHKIFGVFQRLHRPDEYEGTGIGLAIVKKSAERLGGRAGVDSQPGRGSCFWIDLPVNLPEKSSESRAT